MCSKTSFIYVISLSVIFCILPVNSYAAFPCGSVKDSIVETSSAQNSTSLNQSIVGHLHKPAALLASPTGQDRSFKHGFTAYFAAGLGVLGLLFFPIQATLLMMLFGLGAGVFGKIGLKMYKHDKLLKALCYIGIILGALLVLFATIPILFLL
ncbi:hypothetical protein CJD36_004415 [Flavipsychrobacter stenotrophus]|uniref:Uncharacterized protein n=1 Tax=Flavipsychrobacter stenotrophus TaxID=2077091 RepID=A0A2S7T205_9BACT|nr:hypothetical protein [Flavipsychrobacter stenotrophus]PQJ12994.1 hypothetical protein CJD36_004415 [Flavipsychrobacter stenotrophus]